jgi:hypothetical protein
MLSSPYEPSVITYIAQFYFLFSRQKPVNATSAEVKEKNDKPPEKAPSASDKDLQKIEKLKKLLLKGLDELAKYVQNKKTQLAQVVSIEDVIKHKNEVKGIIATNKVFIIHLNDDH